MDSQEMKEYYETRLRSIREHYKQEGEISFINSLDELVLNSKNILDESKGKTLNDISEIEEKKAGSDVISRLHARRKIFSINLHNSNVDFNNKIISNFIKDCKPSHMKIDAIDFNGYKI